MSRPRARIVQLAQRGAPLLAAIVLAAMAVEVLSRPRPGDASGYHAAVRAAGTTLPWQIGPWEAERVDPPPDALALLEPNLLISRRYTHSLTGETVHLLLEQSRDARDLAGHYPTRCYPHQGWVKEQARQRTWQVGSWTIPGTQYRFSFTRPEGVQRMVVVFFVILPDGRVLPGASEVYEAASDYAQHFYGAGQWQMLFPIGMDQARRDAVLERFVAEARPVLDVMRSGLENATPDSEGRDG
ncbi:MAG: exosortase-associated EpsI family protein [Phycisphaeraceae bacterium]